MDVCHILGLTYGMIHTRTYKYTHTLLKTYISPDWVGPLSSACFRRTHLNKKNEIVWKMRLLLLFRVWVPVSYLYTVKLWILIFLNLFLLYNFIMLLKNGISCLSLFLSTDNPNIFIVRLNRHFSETTRSSTSWTPSFKLNTNYYSFLRNLTIKLRHKLHKYTLIIITILIIKNVENEQRVKLKTVNSSML